MAALSMLPSRSSRRRHGSLHRRITTFETAWKARLSRQELEDVRSLLRPSHHPIQLTEAAESHPNSVAFFMPPVLHSHYSEHQVYQINQFGGDGRYVCCAACCSVELCRNVWLHQRIHPNAVNHIEIGLHFCVQQTAEGDLYVQGTPQQITYEALAGTGRKTRGLCHSPVARSHNLIQADAAAMASPPTTFPLQTLLLPVHRYSVRQVACGVSHCITLARSSTGELHLLAWGVGTYGQLGLGEDVSHATTMTVITATTDLQQALACRSGWGDTVQLRCGPLSSCVAVVDTASTSLWMWGRLPSTPKATHQWTPASDIVSTLPFAAKDLRVGLSHIVVLSEQGDVFTWGQNDKGQLGLGHHHRSSESTTSLHRVQFPHAVHRIDAIACGYDHTLALSHQPATVFAWGSNRVGACGAATKFFEYFHPVVVSTTAAECITAIACRAHTSIAVAAEKMVTRVFVWGVVDSSVAQLLPVQVPDLASSTSVAASFGGVHCLAQDDHSFAAPACDQPPPQPVSTSHEEDPRATSTCDLRVIGVSVLPASQQQRSIHELRWMPPSTHRIRVFTSDTVAVLVRSSLPITAESLVLQLPLEASDEAPPPLSCQSLTASLSLVVLWPCPSAVQHDLSLASSESLTLLSITRCVPSATRHATLSIHRCFLQRCLRSLDSRSNWTEFLHAVRQQPDVDAVIGHSPLAVESGEDALAAVSWDIDRCVVERAALLSGCYDLSHELELPSELALWSPFVQDEGVCFALLDDIAVEGLALLDLLQASIDTQPLETVYLSIAHTIVSSGPTNVPAQEPLMTLSVAATKPLSTPLHHAATSVHVPQSALEFLVSGSIVKQQQPSPPHNHEAGTVFAWTSDRGDLFYSPDTAPTTRIHVHLHDYQPTALHRLQRDVHAVLWRAMDSQSLSIRQLHAQMAPIASALDLRTRVLQLARDNDQYDGCDHELWYSLFEAMRGPQPASRSSVSLQSLRVFMVDPFHDAFWQQYVGGWRQATATMKRVDRLLAEAFGGYAVAESGGNSTMDWRAFVDGLTQLHARLQWGLASDEICRLLYRFDSRCDGSGIAVHGFFQCLAEAARAVDTGSGQWQRQGRLDRARTSARPPSVDEFATPQAVKKLYQARAEAASHSLQEPRRKREAGDGGDRMEAIGELLRMGNSRLARIRNLPVSKLLSEGVHFRRHSSKQQRYRVDTEEDDDELG